MNIRGFFNKSATMIVSAAESTYNICSNTFNVISSYPAIGSYAKSFGLQFWEGFSRVFDPNNITKMSSAPLTRETIWESNKANILFYLSLGLVLEMSKNAISTRVMSKEQDTWPDYILYFALNSTVFVAMSGIAIHRFYDNILLRMTVAQQVPKEVPLNAYYQSCHCGTGATLNAGFMNTPYLLTELSSIGFVNQIPIVKYFTPIAYACVYGKSLVEYPYAAIGTCPKHTVKKLEEEIGHTVGAGASLYFLGETISFLVFHFTGASSPFIKDAIYSALYPYFVTAFLFRDREMPKIQYGIDFFYLHRYLTDQAVNLLGRHLAPLIDNPTKKTDLTEMIAYIMNPQRAYYVKQWFAFDLYENWRSPNEFVLNTVNKLFFQEYYGQVIGELNKLIRLRFKPFYQHPIRDMPMALLAPLVPSMPTSIRRQIVSDDTNEAIKLFYADWTKNPLLAIRNFCVSVHLIHIKSNMQVIPDDDLSLKSATNAEEDKQLVTTSKQGLFANSQTSHRQPLPDPHEFVLMKQLKENKRKFLLELKKIVGSSSWDTKGFLGAHPPGHISGMRIALKSLHSESREEFFEKAFLEVKKLFANYDPKAKRHPDLLALYPKIMNDISVLIGDDHDGRLALICCDPPAKLPVASPRY